LTSLTSVVVAAGPATNSPRGPSLMSSTSVVVNAGPAASTSQGPAHRRLQLRWWPLPDLLTAPPRGCAIDVSNFGGDHCRTYRQHPPGGPPSTSLSSVVATAGPAGSTPQGPTIDVSNFGEGRSAIDVSNFGGDGYQTCWHHPLAGPPSMSPTSVVAAVGSAGSTPRGPAIDVSNFGDGQLVIDISNFGGAGCCSPAPLEGPPSTSPTFGPPAPAPPGDPPLTAE
jgi:hypothetical protein